MDQHLDLIASLLSGGGTQMMARIGIVPFGLLLAAALAGSLIVARLYTYAMGARATGSGLHRAFPLFGLLLAAIFITVQFSLPMSLGLLAALTFVRFRTPVKEPEEIGFLLLVVAVAVASASFRLTFAGLLLLVAAALLLVRGRGPAARAVADGLCVISTPAPDEADRVPEVSRLIGLALPEVRLASWSRDEGRTVLAYAFRGAAPDALRSLEARIQRTAPQSTVSIFLNRPELQ